MRNKSKIRISIVTFGIIFAFLFINNHKFFNEQDGIIENGNKINIKRLKSSGNYFESFIHVNGNWSETATIYDWCSGDGSWSNPYTIENVIINASTSPTGNGILINNSKNEYIIIRNCTIHNAGRMGIWLENTNNGRLINNTCIYNGEYGIILNINCINNTIFDNIVNSNTGQGIQLRDFCENNTVSGNIIDNNGWCGIRVRYSSSNNIISGNTISDNNWEGIYLDENCDNNLISENTITNNGRNGGIMFSQLCDNNTISGNTANANTQNGIYLVDDCDDNTISGNTANNNTQFGIYLIEHCDVNTISGNTVSNNSWFGIVISSDNNLIYQNFFIGNNYLHAHDDGINNQWNNSIIGNYWDNHTSPDSNNDGIVDTPYIWIMGSAGSKDYFPLAETPFHSGEKVHIDDSGVNAWNWSTTARLKFWCTGSGTYSDPYIIDGLEIDAGGSGSCILINNSKNEYFIIINCTVYNAGSGGRNAGIKLENTNNGTLKNNNCSNNGYFGILLDKNCKNNTISKNVANDNECGICLISNCNNNTILDNTANNNLIDGIMVWDCKNNSISYNTLNSNDNVGIIIVDSSYNTVTRNIANNNKDYGIMLYGFTTYCLNNTVSGNTASNTITSNQEYGIYLIAGSENTISNNTVNNNNQYGIELYYSSYNSISGNTIYYNKHYGVHLTGECNENNITENYIYFNTNGVIFIDSSDCDDNRITRNIFVSSDQKFINDDGTNTVISMNYELLSPPQLYVEIVDQLFSIAEFTITINVFSELPFDFSILNFQIWWNGIVVNSITELEHGLYNISLTPIFVNPGDDPILLNMTITAIYHLEKYFETYIAVEPCEIVKYLQVDITDTSYSLEHFNFTFFIFNETEQGIDATTIQMWWDGVDVSAEVKNLGNGYYFISLEPITVAPGEDPILLKMAISASGYEDKQFETYLAVDPETLEKGVEQDGDEFPFMILIIAIVSTAGGIGAAIITIGILRKRKPTTEVI
ncbi:MAG: right-handed parallel beta-helix repeat-containing protein [Candidatus Lokiarchaeota archaeon]|nr:right-handed parallel beta-helix repeat-containing protein [Candidatus Lokiarchaeota archaeon]